MKRIGGFLRILVPALFLAAGIGYALHVHEGYARGQREYKELDNEYIFSVDTDYGRDERDPKESEIHGSYRTDIDETDDMEKEDAMQEKRIWKPLITPLPEDAPERFSVNWNELLAKNEDVAAWIRVPAIEISYPVLQAEDNDYYLHRDINREYLFAGSVFLDAANNASFLNYNTIIYGHNMRDGSMFAKLKEFLNKETFLKCRYFWIMTPEADLLYEIFSIHYAVSGSDTFTIRFQGFDAYESWLNDMAGMSVIEPAAVPETQDRIVTLSTCTEDSSRRMTVGPDINSRYVFYTLLNLRPNSSPTITIGSHIWVNPPSRTIRTNSSGQSQKSPSPNTNFVVPQASFSPALTTPNKSISIKIVTSIPFTSINIL